MFAIWGYRRQIAPRRNEHGAPTSVDRNQGDPAVRVRAHRFGCDDEAAVGRPGRRHRAHVTQCVLRLASNSLHKKPTVAEVAIITNESDLFSVGRPPGVIGRSALVIADRKRNRLVTSDGPQEDPPGIVQLPPDKGQGSPRREKGPEISSAGRSTKGSMLCAGDRAGIAKARTRTIQRQGDIRLIRISAAN